MICPLCKDQEPHPYPHDNWEPPCYLCEDAGKLNAVAGWLWEFSQWVLAWGGELMEVARKRAAR